MKEKLFELLKGNLKNPKLYVFLFFAMIIGLLLFPYIDANFFYYERVEKRIQILERVLKIDEEDLHDNPILENEYRSILNEISKQKDGSVGSVFITESTRDIQIKKYISGGLLSWLVALCCWFIKFEKFTYKFLGFFLFSAFGCALGYISMILPTVISPQCNYYVMPLLQIIILGMFATSGKKMKM